MPSYHGLVERLSGWRTWDPRALWVGALGVAGTLLAIKLLTGHHHAAVQAFAVLLWLAGLSAITVPAAARMRRRRRAAAG